MIIKTLTLGFLKTNCYLFSTDNSNLFIIDPADNPDSIIQAVQETGLIPVGIILTHTHFDHILAAGKLVETYPDAGVYVYHSEVSNMGKAGREAQFMTINALVPQMMPYVQEALSQLPEVTSILHQSDAIPLSGLAVIHTPGHTQGSICLYAKDDGILFSGDTLFLESIGQTDYPGGNHIQLVESIQRELLTLPDTVQVCPGHGEKTTIGHERKHNPYIR